MYGFQWRHFGAEYKDMHADYQGQGVDQLQQVIDKIKNSPDDRRIIICAWNPKGDFVENVKFANLLSSRLLSVAIVLSAP